MENKFEQVQPVLRCPITKQGLRLLTAQEIALVNAGIEKGETVHNDGTPVRASIESGYISEAGEFIYPILEGIILLLANLAIPTAGQKENARASLRAEKKNLQDFYDVIGWKKDGHKDTSFVDALKWEDLRPVASEYIHNCHLRVNRHLQKQGHFLLDAGSGPIQYPEYLGYSDGYDFRICVDLSFLALLEAQKKLGDKGIYILGDITNLPLKDSVVDGAVSLHVIYHVPKDEQIAAFRELHRVIKPGTSAAVVYSWPNPALMKWLLFPRRMKRNSVRWIQKQKSLVKKILRWERREQAPATAAVPETPYHYNHDQAYFETNLKGMDHEIVVWRSVNVPFLRMYIHPHMFGAGILRTIYRLEEADPTRYARIGQYPLFVIHK